MSPSTRILPLLAVLAPTLGQAATFMDATWADAACKAWNQSEDLTTRLGGDSWSANDAGRGYKVIQLYRIKCGEQTKVELEIADRDGKAICVRGGAVQRTSPSYDVDYLMYATDEDWACMGEGSFGCGAMGAMMSGKLKFKGPKVEAMGVMGPFNAFLTLTGKVPGDKTTCPK